MAREFHLRVLAADRPFYEGPCVSLVVPAVDGSMGILAGHSNTIAALVPGAMSVTLPSGERRTAAVSGGLIKVENNEVLVLADSAERPDEIDTNRAKRAEARAKEAILQKQTIREYKFAQATLARAINRLKVSQIHDTK